MIVVGVVVCVEGFLDDDVVFLGVISDFGKMFVEVCVFLCGVKRFVVVL